MENDQDHVALAESVEHCRRDSWRHMMGEDEVNLTDETVPPAERPTNEYLRFEERWLDGRKTQVVLVFSARSGEVLAHLTWWGPWRQFVFKPSEHTAWNVGCLATIDAYIAALMADHSAGRTARKGPLPK